MWWTRPQVSTSSSVMEEREATLSSSSAEGTIQWDPSGEAVETKEKSSDEAMQPLKPVTVRFVLEESSGYMEPMLRILAIMHTVISFFCIIGYYCLKVGLLHFTHTATSSPSFSRLLHWSFAATPYVLSMWGVCTDTAGFGLGGFRCHL